MSLIISTVLTCSIFVSICLNFGFSFVILRGGQQRLQKNLEVAGKREIRSAQPGHVETQRLGYLDYVDSVTDNNGEEGVNSEPSTTFATKTESGDSQFQASSPKPATDQSNSVRKNTTVPSYSARLRNEETETDQTVRLNLPDYTDYSADAVSTGTPLCQITGCVKQHMDQATNGCPENSILRVIERCDGGAKYECCPIAPENRVTLAPGNYFDQTEIVPTSNEIQLKTNARPYTLDNHKKLTQSSLLISNDWGIFSNTYLAHQVLCALGKISIDKCA